MTTDKSARRRFRLVLVAAPAGGDPDPRTGWRNQGRMNRLVVDPTTTSQDWVLMVTLAVEQGWGTVVMVMAGREAEALGMCRLEQE